MNETTQMVINAISTVGFPIGMCLILCYYIYKVQDSLTKAINELTQMVRELNTELRINGGRGE